MERSNEGQQAAICNKQGGQLYEIVLAKNFQIIENFLSKFHQIFQKQEEFENRMESMENVLIAIKQSSDNNKEYLESNVNNYDKKVHSLKEFIIQKFSAIQEFQKNKQSKSEQEQGNLMKQKCRIENFCKQTMEKFYWHQKKSEERVIQNIKNYKMEVEVLSKRVNSIEQQKLTINESIFEAMAKAQQFFKKSIEANVFEFQKEFVIFRQIFKKQRAEIERKIILLSEEMKEKLKISSFQIFEKKYNENCKNFSEEIINSFASKTETKKALVLFQKKLLKLEIIENIMKEYQQKNENISVVPASIMTKVRPKSIHAGKKPPLTDVKPSDNFIIKKFGQGRPFDFDR